MRRINLFSYGMMSLLKLFARVLVIVLAVSLFQQAHSAQAVPVRPPHFDRRAMPEALAAPVRSPKGDAAKPAPDWCFYVLEYHNFTENVSQAADYTMTVSALRRDLDFLRDNGYTTVLPRELAAGQLDDGSPLPQKAVLLTFDDGYESNYTLAFPILREYGAKAAISLITSRIDERANGFLTWDECREMAKSGLVEFASHTNDCHIRPDAPGIERKKRRGRGDLHLAHLRRPANEHHTHRTRNRPERHDVHVSSRQDGAVGRTVFAAALCRHTLRRLRHCPLRRLPLPPAALQHHRSSSRQRVPPRLLTGSQELRILKASIFPIKRDDKERSHE